MLEDRIGFAVGQKLDDEIPVVVSIMASYSASAVCSREQSRYGVSTYRVSIPWYILDHRWEEEGCSGKQNGANDFYE